MRGSCSTLEAHHPPTEGTPPVFKHIPVIGAIFPAAAALWFIHPNSATATVAGVSGAAALAEVKLKAVAAERRKRKAAKAVAKAQADAPQLPTVQAPYA